MYYFQRVRGNTLKYLSRGQEMQMHSVSWEYVLSQTNVEQVLTHYHSYYSHFSLSKTTCVCLVNAENNYFMLLCKRAIYNQLYSVQSIQERREEIPLSNYMKQNIYACCASLKNHRMYRLIERIVYLVGRFCLTTLTLLYRCNILCSCSQYYKLYLHGLLE